jgi:hypothetical protein
MAMELSVADKSRGLKLAFLKAVLRPRVGELVYDG